MGPNEKMKVPTPFLRNIVASGFIVALLDFLTEASQMALSVVSQWIQKRLVLVLSNVTQVPSTRLPMCKQGNNQRVQLAIKLTCEEIIYQAVYSCALGSLGS